MDRNFAASLKLVLRYEGGFSNNKADPGGATNLGITLATFRRYIKPNGTVDDLKKLTVDQAGTCYRRQYWDAVAASDLPSGIDFAVFDLAVNSGVSRAAKFLQAVVGVPQDGKIGPATLAAVRKMMRATVINDLCDKRMAFLKSLKTWKTFGKGWTARVSSVRAEALKMAAQPDKEPPVIKEVPVEVKVPVPVETPVVPASVGKAVKNHTRNWGWGGIASGGVGAAITSALGDWKIVALFAGIGIAGAVVAFIAGPLIVRRFKQIQAEVEG